MAHNPISVAIKAVRRSVRVGINLARLGLADSIRVFNIYAISPLWMRIQPNYLRLYRRRSRNSHSSKVPDLIDSWRGKEKELLERGVTGYTTSLGDFGLEPDMTSRIRKQLEGTTEVIIADVDQDGFFWSHFGPLEGSPTVSQEEFVKRKRFNLQVVGLPGPSGEGIVGLRKDYRGDESAFVTELVAVHKLGLAGCSVPTIHAIDFDHLRITISFIRGRVLREALAELGATVRDRDVEAHDTFTSLSEKESELKRISEGRHVLAKAVDEAFVEKLFEQVRMVHQAGFILNDIKYGNIIIEAESGDPYLIDFDMTHDYSDARDSLFRALRDGDIQNFNHHFVTDHMTYSKIKAMPKIERIYAPAYFGSGIRAGQIWDVEAGYGRWQYILAPNLPSLTGKRTLDLGTNNSFNSLQMLRNGARQAYGIELDDGFIAQGNLYKEIFEWADNRSYDFNYVQGNMETLPDLHLGEFDLVIALCSLYYLEDQSIQRLISYISTITNTFVVQCNTAQNIGRDEPETYEKASVDYTVKTLKANGFPEVRVIAPMGYPRPLVIGTK